MLRKIFGIFLLFVVVSVSITIVIIPTFFTKNISRTSLHKEIRLKAILDSKEDIEILFFGYSGCSDICTPRLETIAKLYDTLDAQTKKRVSLKFLDISLPADKTLPQRFANYFHKDFRGVYLDNKVLREYTKVFSVYFAPSLSDKTEYDHTTNLYIVKRSKRSDEIRYIYSAYPYDFQQIKLDIKELIDE